MNRNILNEFERWDINIDRYKKHKFLYFNYYKHKVKAYKIVYLLRKCQTNSILKLIYRLRYNRLCFKCGIEINPKTKIGKGFVIGHPSSIVVNANTIIGENVHLTKGVLIGLSKSGKHKGSPVIGNNVVISANAVLVGNIKIGNNVFIAANTFVNRDIPDNSIVLGNPAIIKSAKEFNPVWDYIK